LSISALAAVKLRARLGRERIRGRFEKVRRSERAKQTHRKKISSLSMLRMLVIVTFSPSDAGSSSSCALAAELEANGSCERCARSG